MASEGGNTRERALAAPERHRSGGLRACSSGFIAQEQTFTRAKMKKRPPGALSFGSLEQV